MNSGILGAWERSSGNAALVGYMQSVWRYPRGCQVYDGAISSSCSAARPRGRSSRARSRPARAARQRLIPIAKSDPDAQAKSPIALRRRGFLAIENGCASSAVFVVAAHPFHHIAVGAFVAAKRRKIEEAIGPGQFLAGARVGRVGVVDRSVGIFEEHAFAVQLFHGALLHFEIVLDRTRFQIFFPKRDMKIVIEIVVLRGHPGESPTHSFLVGLNLLDAGPRHRRK